VAAVPPDQMVPWLSAAAVRSARGRRMTELFAHGQDIADAVGVPLERTDRIRHIAEFATGLGLRVSGARPQPAAQTFRFVLAAPSGAWWEFGPTEATQQVTGPRSISACSPRGAATVTISPSPRRDPTLTTG